MKTFRRKLAWDRGGVSEVIGTILTLSITVVLFSSIIAMVDQFPAPGDNVYTDFAATVEPVNGTWTLGAFIHITNTGGQQMTGLWTMIVITIDDYNYILNTQGTIDNITYGLGPGVFGHRGSDNGDDNWDTGERWTLFRNSAQINSASNIGAMVLDQERNALVWSAQIQGSSNIFGPIISEIKADSDLDSLRADPVQFGREFYLFARVYDPDGDLDTSSVRADLTSILPGAANASIPMDDADGDGIYRSGPIMGPDAIDIPIGYHIALVKANDLSGSSSIGSGRISVGMDVGGQPNLLIRTTDISVNPQSPINGQTVTVAATVRNYGGWCNGYVQFYDIVGTNAPIPIGMMNFTLSQGPSQVTRSVSWVARPGGEHEIMAHAIPYEATDVTPEDNYNSTFITVLPKILLVDDDNHPADLSDMDTVSSMRGALESSDFGYDLYTVGPYKDGPGYNLGQTKMVDYDVIIWMTGYENTRTLTAFDRANITAFLNGVPRGGSLWMIGQRLYEDAAVPASFFEDNLKASGHALKAGGPTNPLMGVAGNPVSFEWNSTYIPVVNRVSGFNYSYSIEPAPGAEITFRDSSVNSSFGDAVNYENATKDSRVVFFPWEFSRIQRTSDQTQVAYRVLKWLGNITLRHGEDLAVSEQTVTPSYVFFNQVVRVDAEIRNNGENNLTAQAGLFLDGRNEPEAWIPTVIVPGKGGSVTVSANWTARQLGVHVLKWIVDPNNLIAETNEGNNEIPDYVSSGEVFVEFRILVVDDDGSPNNGGTLADDTHLLTDSLTRLGYTYESPNGVNTTLVVGVNSKGPGIDTLMQYSSVIWMTGANVSGLTANDSYSLEQYVNNYQGLLWLCGNDLWSGISGANITADMGIGAVTANLNLAGTLRGKDNSPISHGMNISVRTNSAADALAPLAGAEGVFYQSYTASRYCAVSYDGGSYMGFTMAFNMSTLYGSGAGYLSGDNALDELTYMVLHWMDKPDRRSEVRITERDYYVSDLHPQIGGAYILRATVHNVGAEDANVLVRFMDGTTQIGADSISISPDGQTSAELIWTPLFAGQRSIGILVDPVNDVDEIFQWFNNNRTFSIYVYFFWDDMESGSGKWSHSSTIININGEGPLDFMTGTYASINTDVVGTFDWSRTVGVDNASDSFHSYPRSYFMEEPTGAFGVKVDVLISFAIDDSRSMQDRFATDGSSWLTKAKDAALTLLNQLSNDSVCVSIWDFEGNNERRWAGPTESVGGGRLQNDPVNHNVYPRAPVRLGNTYKSTINGSDISGRQYIRDEITAMSNPPGQTIMWDAIGEAYLDTEWFIDTYPTLMPVVVVLSDGCDSQASDQSPISDNRIEGGSDYWSPWSNMANGTVTFTEHKGKYTFDWANPTTSTQWLRAMTHGGSMDYTRLGLLYPTEEVRLFTVGLGLEGHPMPPTPSTTLTTWPGEVHDYTNALCKDTSVAPACLESGTVEYNLWRIANTSGGAYFYAPDADALEDVFEQLGQIIATGGFNQTKSSAPAPETRAVNSNKKAVTPAVDLRPYEKATFSFWHRYNLLSGGNGGIIGVEVWEPTEFRWKFLYIIPPGAYTGGIYYGYSIYDDFGNLMRWCFNGISGRNTYTWDYASVDIIPFIEQQGLNSHGDPDYFKGNVRLVFAYVQFGGGTGKGWHIDDVKLSVSRADVTAIDATTRDIWQLANLTATGVGAHSGNHAWSNIDPATNMPRTGIDNSLVTTQIDLTNARSAYLSAYFKFNFNQNSGSPPDGFRVEISSNGGKSWNALNLGIRSSWGVSGTGTDLEDGSLDGKSYTGFGDSGQGNYAVDGYWVSAGTLSRLNVDLSSWMGSQVIIRFRMVVNNINDGTYPHTNNAAFGSNPGFAGFYVDDVNVYGQTIFS